jgi:hypothetical protein
MKIQSSAIRNSLFALALIMALPAFRAVAQSKSDSAPAAQAAAIPARITQTIDETQLVTLKGNLHPLARPEFDQGIAPPDLPVQRVLLVLKRSPDQESVLTQLLSDQQNKASANFHNWLTPEQFGAQFGLADKDVQTISSWLQSHGFQVGRIAKGKNFIEFSGTAGQIREAFHTEIHKYVVNGQAHWANSTEPQIPASLADTVYGPISLSTFRPKPLHHELGPFARSRNTGLTQPVSRDFSTGPTSNFPNFFAVGPSDWATIYNVQPLWTAGTDGTGQTIAVVGVSNINLQDVTDFRNLFGLPTNAAVNTPNIIIDGADPGVINDGSETEALLDVEWSGAVAKNAQIDLVIAADADLGLGAGLSLAMFHVIEYNLAPVMSVSFGNCEAALGVTNTQGISSMWQQAAAQGITVVVSSGDAGSAGCENSNASAPNPATTGLQVSGFASSAFNVAVGGTDFNDATNPLTYFKTASMQNQATLESAIGYIPETTWNDTCTNAIFNTVTGLTTPEANCNSTNAGAKASVFTVGGGGGVSTVNPKPAYQSFAGLTGSLSTVTMRAVPDVSLFSGDGFIQNFYAMCEADATPAPSCAANATDNINFFGVGGTSAGTPSFAGVMALVNQKTGQRQGIANFVIYKLAQTQFQAGTACNSVASPLPAAACTFNDITTGTNATPCTKGSTNCNTTVSSDTIGVLSGYNAGTGYDFATGLGSINANNLVNNWTTGAATFTPTSTSLSINLPAGFTAGQSATLNITVTPSSGTVQPSGDVGLTSTATIGQGVDGFVLNSSGQVVNGTTTQLTGGTYSVTAHYDGDGTFAPSDSTPVMVTVAQASSTTSALAEISLGAGTYSSFTTAQAPVTVFLQAVINPTGVLLPFGTVNFVDTFNGVPTTVASNITLNSAGEAFTFPGIATFAVGNHSIVANYSGDASFTASSSPAVTFAITAAPAPSITSLTPNSGAVGTSVTIAGANFGATQGTTSTVTFNGTAATPTSWSTSSIAVPVPAGATTGNVVVTVGGAASNGMTFTVTSSGSFTLAGAAATVTAGGSGNSAITLTPTGGFIGSVAITCGATLPGVSCSPLTVTVPSGGANGTGQLAINVTAPSTSMTAMNLSAPQTFRAAKLPAPSNGKNGWWTLSGGTGLAAIFLLLLPGRKRYRAALGLGLVCVFSFILGCGGGSGGGGGGQTVTVTHLTVSSTKLAATGTLTVSATVTGGTPAGNVQFFVDGAAAAGNAVPVASGTTGNIMLTATSAPALFQLIGTHTLGAQYLGDTTTQPSVSGSLNITITGTTQLPISASPASSNANATVSLTIN